MKKTYLHTTKVLFAFLTFVSLALFISCTNSVAEDAGTTKGESTTTREVTLEAQRGAGDYVYCTNSAGRGPKKLLCH